MKKLSNYLWWNKTNFNGYNTNSNNNSYAGVSLNQPFNNESNMNSKNNPKKGKRPLILFATIITCSCLGVGLFGVAIYEIINSSSSNNKSTNSSSSTDSSDLEYNNSSDATNWISERTFSLLFTYTYQPDGSNSGSATAGTGWIYYANESSNTFYIATNLHVASILSYAGQTVTYYDENSSEFVTETYSNISAYLGLSFDANESSSSYSNNIVYFPVSTPTVVYTTTTDSDFNAAMNDSMNQKNYYGYSLTSSNQTINGSYIDKYYGASDIAVLEYTINPSTYSNQANIFTNQTNFIGLSNISSSEKQKYVSEFKQWISNYFDDPTIVYSDYMENLSNISSTKLYMAGYPSYDSSTGDQGSGISSISWLSFSDFKITSIYGTTTYPGNSYLSSQANSYTYPIAYFSSASSDYTDYNYISIGIQSLLYADSFSGASGSPIVMENSNGGYEIVGIYWGSKSWSYNSYKFKWGIMTWFDTNNYELDSKPVSYSITDGINSVIGISK